jgi:hypothetical protein
MTASFCLNIEIVIGVKQEGYWEDWMNAKTMRGLSRHSTEKGRTLKTPQSSQLIVQYALAWFA